MSLVEEEIKNYDGFNENDYLIGDRGFAKIEFIIYLVKKRKVNVIIPVKKNRIYLKNVLN